MSTAAWNRYCSLDAQRQRLLKALEDADALCREYQDIPTAKARRAYAKTAYVEACQAIADWINSPDGAAWRHWLEYFNARRAEDGLPPLN